MINLNGTILTHKTDLSNNNNRAFLYADGLFDTLLLENNHPVFIEAHYFRLLAGIRQLRMEIPFYFTQNYWEQEIYKLAQAAQLSHASIRTTIFRNSKGLYTPKSNSISYAIEIRKITQKESSTNLLGIYKDNTLNTNPISTLKTNNKLINVLASIYAKEQGYNSCILLNHKRQIAETTNANLFVVFGNQIKTPDLSEGCVRGIIREKIIQIVDKHPDFELVETAISPFELAQADEVFTSNSIQQIQAITQFKKKSYENMVSTEISLLLAQAVETDKNQIVSS